MRKPHSMSEHPNVAVAMGLWAATADGDAEAMRRHFTDDVTWTSAGRNPLAGERRGPEEVFDYLARVGETADDFRSKLEGVYAGDEGAIIEYHVSAKRGRKRLEMDYVLLLRIRSGRVARVLSVPVDQYDNDAFWS